MEKQLLHAIQLHIHKFRFMINAQSCDKTKSQSMHLLYQCNAFKSEQHFTIIILYQSTNNLYKKYQQKEILDNDNPNSKQELNQC